ncbi:MAG: DUF554 domain-containing protein [bacterium]
MTGTFINTGAVIAGSLIGVFLQNIIPPRINNRIMQGVGLFTLVLGFDMVQDSENLFLLLISLVMGAIIGELLQLEDRLDRFGQALQTRFNHAEDRFTKGFIITSLLFCVGPMAILGAIEDGLTGDYTLLLTKSVLDGVSAIAFASTLGIGVLFSAGTLFFYQGIITIAAAAARSILTAPVISALTATGGVLIIGLGLNILDIVKIKVANFLPALVIAVFLGTYFFTG